MKVKRVENIPWAGGALATYVILRDGPLRADSIVTVPSLFLAQSARDGKSELAIKARAYDLKTFFTALEIAGLDWSDITDNQMSGYLETTLHSALGLQERSIQRNCSSLGEFYDFSERFGLTQKHFNFSFTYSTSPGHVKKGAKPPSRFIPVHKKYINEEIFEIVLSNTQGKPGFLRSRDELVLSIGYRMGLCTEEVTAIENLNIEYLQNKLAEAEDANKLTISVDIQGKNKKTRSVDLDPTITDMVRRFITRWRLEIPGTTLICDQKGKPLCESHGTRVFARAKKTSLPAIKKKIQELSRRDDAPYTISFTAARKLTFHCLRHTFTTDLVTYCYVHNIDPKTYVKNQLGHVRDATTEIYINFEASMHNRDLLRARFSIGREA